MIIKITKIRDLSNCLYRKRKLSCLISPNKVKFRFAICFRIPVNITLFVKGDCNFQVLKRSTKTVLNYNLIIIKNNVKINNITIINR